MQKGRVHIPELAPQTNKHEIFGKCTGRTLLLLMGTDVGVVAKHMTHTAPGQVTGVVVVARVLAPVTDPWIVQVRDIPQLDTLGILDLHMCLHLARLISIHIVFSCESLKKHADQYPNVCGYRDSRRRRRPGHQHFSRQVSKTQG
jgi:hypothetical protein